MNTKKDPAEIETTAHPAAIIVLAVALVGLVLWLIGPNTSSRANPYLNDAPQSSSNVIGNSATVPEAKDV